jgi:hypothetical protein
MTVELLQRLMTGVADRFGRDLAHGIVGGASPLAA